MNGDQDMRVWKKQSAGFGFTLIELLVVISIIALLLSVLMPSLQKARDKAKTIVCRSNLKQIGLASILYSNTYNDAMVSEDSYWQTPANNRHSYPWYFSLIPFVSSKTPNSGEIVQRNTAVQVFRCPSQKDVFNIDNGGVLYGIDVICATHFFDPATGQPPKIVKRITVTRPSIRMHIADSMDQSKPPKAELITKYMLRLMPFPYTTWLQTHDAIMGSQYDIPVSDRHNDGSNVLFVDGRVEWMRFGDVTPLPTERTKDPGSWAKKRRLWDYRQ
jgi:prepilin-type N-terminal cleavage/methylation domain-containing protein/prepilin-type processing-associated H-X9-DG protein